MRRFHEIASERLKLRPPGGMAGWATGLSLVLISCGSREDAASTAPPAARAESAAAATSSPARPLEIPAEMALIPGGRFVMGAGDGFSHEAPPHEVLLEPYFLDLHEVTNAQFAAFVQATGYRTEAERWGWSVVFSPDTDERERAAEAPWWAKVEGADWRHPSGPGSTIDGRESNPVVQVSWHDAEAYCRWAGKRLPTEAEWEFAARGGLEGSPYPWGDDLTPDGRWMANIWQGFFPGESDPKDGHAGLASVGSYSPNGYGLHDMAGNVWEWCADWYGPSYYATSPPKNPQGPPAGEEKVLRGGSFLCSAQYCIGYRVAHRNKATPDSGLDNVGFRCAVSAPQP